MHIWKIRIFLFSNKVDSVALYNLSKDPVESKDMESGNPEIVAQIKMWKPLQSINQSNIFLLSTRPYYFLGPCICSTKIRMLKCATQRKPHSSKAVWLKKMYLFFYRLKNQKCSPLKCPLINR